MGCRRGLRLLHSRSVSVGRRLVDRLGELEELLHAIYEGLLREADPEHGGAPDLEVIEVHRVIHRTTLLEGLLEALLTRLLGGKLLDQLFELGEI